MSREAQDIVDRLNARRPAIIRSLGGRISSVDTDAGSCVIEYDIGENLCHSTNIVQGGIVTAMLDAAMTHAALAQQSDIEALASLEIKVSFLYSAEGRLTAAASTTAKLSRSTD